MELSDPATLGAFVALLTAAGAAMAWLLRQPSAILLEVRRELDVERERRRVAEQNVEELRLATAAARAELAQLREREGRLVRSTGRLADANGLGLALDYASDGIVVSDATNGGTWLWVNVALCEALGLPREKVVELGWRQLIHPEDKRVTVATEGSAWSTPVTGHVTRYRRAEAIGGGWVQLRWHCPAYHGGQTICVVKIERVTP